MSVAKVIADRLEEHKQFINALKKANHKRTHG